MLNHFYDLSINICNRIHTFFQSKLLFQQYLFDQFEFLMQFHIFILMDFIKKKLRACGHSNVNFYKAFLFQ